MWREKFRRDILNSFLSCAVSTAVFSRLTFVDSRVNVPFGRPTMEMAALGFDSFHCAE